MAFDAFLKFTTANGDIIIIEGESTDKGHPNEIQVDSFSWGVSNPSSITAGGGAGRASAQDLNISAHTSKASPNLMLACATGKHLPSALLTCRRGTGTTQIEFMKIRLTDCLISGYSLGGAVTNDGPEDEFSIAFAKMDFLYTVARTGETVETAFDFTVNPPAG